MFICVLLFRLSWFKIWICVHLILICILLIGLCVLLINIIFRVLFMLCVFNFLYIFVISLSFLLYLLHLAYFLIRIRSVNVFKLWIGITRIWGGNSRCKFSFSTTFHNRMLRFQLMVQLYGAVWFRLASTQNTILSLWTKLHLCLNLCIDIFYFILHVFLSATIEKLFFCSFFDWWIGQFFT